MPIARASIIRGPALVQFNSVDFYSKGDITVTYEPQMFDIETSAFGKVDERISDRIVKVSFTPAGEWESLATLFPYASTVIGASMFGADKTLAITPIGGGLKTTYQAAAVTKMPSIMLSAVKTLLGEIEFTCIGKDNTIWDSANSLVLDAAGAAAPSLAAFQIANIKTIPYAAAWGSAPWDAISTADGWTVEFDMQTTPLQVDDSGTVDLMMSSLSVMAKCQPLNVTEPQIVQALGIQNPGLSGVLPVRGRSIQSTANLAITPLSAIGGGVGGAAPSVTLNKPGLKSAGFSFGATTIRNSELAWVATRTITTGAADPLFIVA